MAMLYFAYGSNMHQEQMQERCPGSSPAGTAFLPGYEFGYFRRSERWPGGGAADITRPGRGVWGALYLLADSDLPLLDRWEGVDVGAYRRIEASVTKEGQSLRAITYETIDKMSSPLFPIEAYAERVMTGARQHGLPGEYIEELENKTYRKQKD